VDKLDKTLKKYFGFDNFRPGQKEVIESILSGKDTLAVLPTGGGKSLLFQLPALLQDGITIVVSPLIALMKDQLEALEERGLPATFLNSSLGKKEYRKRTEGLTNGEYKILYVSPERFANHGFMSMLQEVEVSLFAIDEAHLVSLWGHEFRQDYRLLGKVRKEIGNPTVIAVTATATEAVRNDIVEQLGMESPLVQVSGFSRPELTLNGSIFADQKIKSQAFFKHIKKIFENDAIPPMIVYCGSRKDCEMVSELLNKRIKRLYKLDDFSRFYHADMTKKARKESQEAFMNGDVLCIVATIAFGQGIDKSNIRHVIHYTIPSSVEEYYQEVGRAGRDGRPSNCDLFYDPRDIALRTFFIDVAHPPKDWYRRVYYHLLRTLKPNVSMHMIYAVVADEIGGNEIQKYQTGTVLTKLKYAGVFSAPKRGYMLLNEDIPEFEDLDIDYKLSQQRKEQKIKNLETMQKLVEASDKDQFILDYFEGKHG